MSLSVKTFSLLCRFAIPKTIHGATETRSIKRWVSPTLKALKARKDKLGAQLEQPRSSYLEWNYEAELFAFGKRLGEEFDKQLLRQALIQREYANVQEIKAQETGVSSLGKIHNSELIREGRNIILNYITTEYSKLYPEEIVNAIQKYLTSESMLSHIGKHLGLKDIILTNEYPPSDKTLSDTVNALIAALKWSTDLKRAENFIKDFILSQMNGKDVYDIWDPKHPYEYLTKILNRKGIDEIEPRLCNESATNTILACFQVGLYSKKKLLGIGWGESVEIAKNTAALDALKNIFGNYEAK